MGLRRGIPVLLGACALVAGIALSQGAPRLTLLNSGLRVDYPGSRGAALLLAAAGAAVVAAAVPWRGLRIGSGCTAILLALWSADLLLYRLDADEARLTARGLFPGTTLPWSQVSRVEAGPDALVVWGRGDEQIRVPTSSFRPEQRQSLERAVARRIRQSSSDPGPGRGSGTPPR